MGMGVAFATVKRELLVRYLDTWAPAALHGSRPATYADLSPQGSAGDAIRVFAEFPELLTKRGLEIVAAAPLPADLGLPTGLTVRNATGEGMPTLSRDGPLFVYVDTPRPPPTPEELAWLARGKATELFLAQDPGAPVRRQMLRAAGFRSVAEVELVDGDELTQLLLFATNAAKHLAVFKEALWAVDEYAGVRYRDPIDSEHTSLDISLNPAVGPLKRAVLDRVRSGSHTVAELRDYAAAETIYQAADANRAISALLASGAVTRAPDRGRLTAETVIQPR